MHAFAPPLPPGVAPIAINPLSVPRGVKLVDELTGAPAGIQLTLHGVTFYYSDVANQQLDYASVLHKIAPLLAELETSGSSVGTQAERSAKSVRSRALQAEVVSMADAMANAHINAKRFELAIPAALRSLRTTIALHGDGAVEAVPAYLILAEANLGLARTVQADGFLSTANYILVKQPSAPTRLRSRLHRNFGRLYAAQGNNAAALDAFSRDIYFSTLAVGPESIETSIGFFFMAQVFAAQARMEAALAFFDKVVDIFYKRMLGARSSISTALNIDFNLLSPETYLKRLDAAAKAGGGAVPPLTGAAITASASLADTSNAPRPGERVPLTEVQTAEALEMLEFVARVRESHLGKQHISYGEVHYTMALVLVDCDRTADAVPCLHAAEAIFVEHLGEEHPSTADVRALLSKIAA